ncbi:hypothetical protein Rhola_00011100 [Rhodoluna lacicola]|uniref:3-hydroxyacyl-CoA dehydrogenase n=2 Tax=Rhodoluna lacicola TaxID=529884 RepID=A0A060JMU0_9MICO|nr:hypothetical protein Rhola_00011100 [Rhodoluna lacicola]
MGKSGGIMSSKEENKESDNQARQQKPKKQRIKNLVQAEDYFGPQYNKTSELPNPEASLQLLATGVVEVIAGTRQIDQLARLLSDEVYQRLSRRAIEARQLRDATGQKTRYQNFSIRNMMNTSPRDGVIESVVLLNAQRRTRAVTIRLEGINNRWRATAVSVL